MAGIWEILGRYSRTEGVVTASFKGDDVPVEDDYLASASELDRSNGGDPTCTSEPERGPCQPTTSISQSTRRQVTMNTRLPNAEASPLPMPIPIVEAWHLLSDDEADSWESAHDVALQTISILEARDEVVTLEMVGRPGLAYQSYELDLTPSGADELALGLIRRAEEARAEIRTARWKKRRQDDDRHHSSSVDSSAATPTSIDPENPLGVTEAGSRE